MVFDFKKFLQDFIHSIDAKFNKNGIEKAFYHSKGQNGVAYIYLKSPGAAHEVEMKLHNFEVGAMFSGAFKQCENEDPLSKGTSDFTQYAVSLIHLRMITLGLRLEHDRTQI